MVSYADSSYYNKHRESLFLGKIELVLKNYVRLV